jgi:2-amino-4-hydroxy-6-hydroxymethyldihydropteridine diphosphokinase
MTLEPVKSESGERSVISIGSNISPRFDYLQRAVDMFRESSSIDVVAVSRVYETAPVSEEGETYDGDFLNACIVCDVSLSPEDLLGLCHEIERSNGRDRSLEEVAGNHNRTLDCDIIFYGDQQVELDQLVIPHPLWRVREFILRPLEDVREILTEWQRGSLDEVIEGIKSEKGAAMRFEKNLKSP